MEKIIKNFIDQQNNNNTMITSEQGKVLTYGDFKKTLSRYKVDNYFKERENVLESL